MLASPSSPETQDEMLPLPPIKSIDEHIEEMTANRNRASSGNIFSIDDDEDEDDEDVREEEDREDDNQDEGDEDEDDDEDEQSSRNGDLLNLSTLKESVSKTKLSAAQSEKQQFFTPVFQPTEDAPTSTTAPQTVQVSAPPQQTPQTTAQPRPTFNCPTEKSALELEGKVSEICSSSFPDVDELKSLCFQLGYVPDKVRPQVISIVLTGALSEDHEAAVYSNSGLDLSPSSTTALTRDCDDCITSNAFGKSSNAGIDYYAEQLLLANPVETRKDFFDLISLLCARRGVPYHPLFFALLSPLLMTSNPRPRAVVSAAFYALVNFAPIFGSTTISSPSTPSSPSPPQSLLEYTLDHEAARVEKIHSFLRLLVLYHCPNVGKFLDHVVPCWEGAPEPQCDRPVDEGDAIPNNRPSHLDVLEQELGLDMDDQVTPVATGDRAGQGERANRSAGLVPFHLLCGLLTTSLPSPQAAAVVDWAVLANEPYAGVFLMVALLALSEDRLCGMTRVEVVAWFASIGGSKDWLPLVGKNTDTSCEPAADTPSGNEPEPSPRTSGSSQNWAAFASAWIITASSIRRSTPKTFLATLHAPIPTTTTTTSTNSTSSSAGETEHSQSSRVSNLDEDDVTAPSDHAAAINTTTIETTTFQSTPCIFVSPEEALSALCMSSRRMPVSFDPVVVYDEFLALVKKGELRVTTEQSPVPVYPYLSLSDAVFTLPSSTGKSSSLPCTLCRSYIYLPPPYPRIDPLTTDIPSTFKRPKIT